MTAQPRTYSPTAASSFFLDSRRIALALFVLTLVVRIPFMSQTLNHWDSVNHALALTSFNVAAHRPQPPGYILYIGLARLVNLVLPDAQTALVTVSILASAFAVALLFLFGTRLGSREIGLIAALLLMTSPPFWFDGEVALPYVVEGSASIALAFLLYKVYKGETRGAPLAAVVFAIAIGMRQQLALFFVPLVLYAYWKQSWRVRFESLVWFTFVCLLWFVPLIWSAGGITGYLSAVRGLNSAFSSEYVLFGTGGIEGMLRNASRVGAYTLYALNLTLIPLLWGGVQIVRAHSARALWADMRVRFLTLWIAPSVTFYLFFHMGSPGLIYVFLPALYLVSAFALRQLFGTNPRWLAAAVLVLCLVNTFIFVGTPSDLYTGRAIRVLNYRALVEHDRSLTAHVKTIRADFDPESTLVIADDWRFAEYYLPNFRVLFVPGNPAEPLLQSQHLQEEYLRARTLDLSRIETLVWFDDMALRKYKGLPDECLPLEDASCLPVVHLAQKGAVTIRSDGIEVLGQ